MGNLFSFILGSSFNNNKVFELEQENEDLKQQIEDLKQQIEQLKSRK